MAKEKWLYEFSVNKEITETTSEKTKNDKGETITTEKEVMTKVPMKFGIKKPSRKMYDEADLFYSIKLADGIKAGLLTRPLLERRYENDGGVFTDNDKNRYADLYKEIFEKESELQQAALNLEKKETKEKREKIAMIYADLTLLRRELQDYEVRYSSLFDQTAENRAKNSVIMWWVLNLSFQEDGENFKPVFEGKNYDEKLDRSEEFDEGADLFWDESIKKLIYLVSFWHSGQGNTKEDFENAENFYTNSYGLDDEDVVLDESTEESTEEKVEEEKEVKVKPKKKRGRKPKKEVVKTSEQTE